MCLDAGEKIGHRVPGSRSVEKKLCVDDVLVAVGIERENVHATPNLKSTKNDGITAADDQVARPKGAGDGGKETRRSRKYWAPGWSRSLST